MLVDRSARVWAMRRDDAVAAQALELRTVRDKSGQPMAIMAGERLEGSDFARVIDGVAVIPVKGPLMRSFSFWAWSYEEILRDVRLAQDDPGVTAIVLDIDSPGGIAAGCEDAVSAIRESGAKPITAFVGGMAASAAYWIATSAEKIVAGSGAIVGSVGAVIEYVDMEPYFEKIGARIVRVVSEQSPNKRLDPDSDAGKAELQALVDATCAGFVATVAKNRNVSAETVIAEFGQGLVFDGAEAIRRGMADGRSTLEDLIAGLAGRDQYPNAAPAAAAQENPMDWASLTLAALREHRPDLVTEIEGAASASTSADTEARIVTAREEAATAERDRILAIEEIATEGHEDKVLAAKKDGRTTAAELALQIVKADRSLGAGHLADRAAADTAAAVTPAKPAASAAGGESIEDKAKAAWDKDAELRAEFGDFASFLSFEKAAASGRARILGARAN